MMADIRRAREQKPRMPVGLMQDGAPEMWTLMREGLKKQARLRRWYEGVDR